MLPSGTKWTSIRPTAPRSASIESSPTPAEVSYNTVSPCRVSRAMTEPGFPAWAVELITRIVKPLLARKRKPLGAPTEAATDAGSNSTTANPARMIPLTHGTPRTLRERPAPRI